MAVITIQELRYRLSATDTGFRQTMANAVNQVQTFGQRVQENTRTLRNWGLALTGIGSGIAYAMKRIVDSTGQAAASVNDVSKQIGFAADSLQRLRFAAEQSGLATQQLNAAMRAFVRRSAEAARGNMAFLASFERIGLSQEEVQAGLADTEELFLRVADGIAQLPTTAEQSAVAMALLGDVGRQMVPMLAGGRQEIERLMRQAEELGIVLDRDNIERFAEYDSTVQRFRAGLSGLRMQVATAILPIFERLARGAEENVKTAVAWVKENKDLIAQGVVLVSTFTALATGLGAVALGASLGVRALGLVTTAVTFLMSPLGLLITLVGLLAVAWSEDWGGIQGITESAVNFITEQWDRLKQWWDESDLGQSVRDWWAKIVAIWESEELTLPEKVVEIAKLVPGIGWVVGFIQDVVGIWRDEELTFGEKTVAIIRLLPGGNWIVGFVSDVKAVWDDEELSFGEKVVAIARLIPGVAWLERFVADVRAIWNDEELTFGEKTVAIARLIPGVAWLQDFVAQVKVIWADEELTLPEKAAEIVRLIPGVSAIENMIAEIKEIWAREDLTFSEKAVETFKVISDTIEVEGQSLAFLLGAAITAPIVLGALADGIKTIPGILAAIDPGNWLRLSIVGMGLALAIFGWRFSNEDPEARENILRQIEDIIDGLFPEGIAAPAKAKVRFTVELVGDLFDSIKKGLETGDWSDVFGATADIWREGVKVGVSLYLAAETIKAILEAITVGMGLSSVSSAGVSGVLGVISIAVALAEAMSQGDYDKFAANMVGALAFALVTAGLTRDARTTALAFTIGINFEFGTRIRNLLFGWQDNRIDEAQNQLNELERQLDAVNQENDTLERQVSESRETAQIERPINQEDIQRQVAETRRMVLDELAKGMSGRFAHLFEEAMAQGRSFDEVYRGIQAGGEAARRVVDSIIAAEPSHEQHRDVLTDIAERLIAIGEAKEAPLTIGELAEAMALVLSESSTVLGNLEAMENPMRVTASGFAELDRLGIQLSETSAGLNRNLEAGLELFRQYKRELGDPGSAAGAFLFPSFARAGEWDRPFNGAGDVAGMTAGVKRDRYLEILEGIFEGGRRVGIAWAEGLRDSATAAEDAAGELAQSVADYLIGQSPPPEGPLSEIDKGGARTIGAWFDGIKSEIDRQGGGLTATLRVLVGTMFDGLIALIRGRYPEAAEFLEKMRDDMSSTLEQVEQRLGGDGGSIADGIRQIRQESILWTDQLVRGLSDAIAYGRSLHDVFDNFLRMLASQFLQTRVFGPLLNSFLPGALSGLPVFHAGGLVLGGAGALVMHNGGMVPGLASDERLIIAQTGERVLSRAQNDRFERMLEEPREVIHYYHINAVDAKSFADLVQRNPEAITAVTLQDIGTNGPIRRAIQAVSRGR